MAWFWYKKIQKYIRASCLKWHSYDNKWGHYCYLCQDNRHKLGLPGDAGGPVILQAAVHKLEGAAELPGGAGYVGHVKGGFPAPTQRF